MRVVPAKKREIQDLCNSPKVLRLASTKSFTVVQVQVGAQYRQEDEYHDSTSSSIFKESGDMTDDVDVDVEDMDGESYYDGNDSVHRQRC